MYSEPTETIELENQRVEIYIDEYPTDPRGWDNLGTMALFHKRYNLGDDHEFTEPQDLHEFMNENDMVYLPVYAYDHGGIALSTNRVGQFADYWDSGMLGYIYVTYERVREEYGWKNLTKERIQKIRLYLQNELEVYNYYVQGRAYGYHLVCSDCGEELDTCWGFYGENWNENGLLDQLSGFTCICQQAKVFQNIGVGL